MNPLLRQWSDPLPGPLAGELEEKRRAGRHVIDLITANPHECGLRFPDDLLDGIVQRALREAPAVRVYTPDARGQLPAREAIAAYYQARGVEADPGAIVLTPGTSMAYFHAFRLLCQPGDEVLVPKPGYPLLDDLCAVCGLKLRYYHLTDRSGQWRIDLDDLAFQLTPRTRIVVAVSPHNPTGVVLSAEELEGIGRLCRKHDLALLFDEVFCEFLSDATAVLPRPRAGDFPLAITLNGFSKMFSLPGWKIAWMKVAGDEVLVRPLLQAIEHLSDAFLPVNELAQAIVPAVLAASDPPVYTMLAAEYRARMSAALAGFPLPCRAPEGGVYITARLPDGVPDEEFALRLLRDFDVLVHPGYYYDMPGHIVMTCVQEPRRMRAGLAAVAQAVRQTRAPNQGSSARRE